MSVDTILAARVRDRAAALARPLDLAGLEAAALAATRDAAIACRPYVGRGDKHAADAAATDAMRRALAGAPGRGTVVIGEGEKDGAPMLYNGERVGAGGPAFDIAVNPLECTTFCATGLPGALATIAVAEDGPHPASSARGGRPLASRFTPDPIGSIGWTERTGGVLACKAH